MQAHRFPAAARTSAVVLSLLSSVVVLSACDRAGDNRASDVPRQAGQAVSNAGDAVAPQDKDVTITAAVNTRLASDERLGALKIDVDTTDGRVLLRGTAPDAAARTRATELARSVDGVATVDNELSVQATTQ